MIRVSVREQDRIDARKLGHLQSGRRYPGQEEAELIIEVWISQYANPPEFQQ